jgi:hypothetical protein
MGTNGGKQSLPLEAKDIGMANQIRTAEHCRSVGKMLINPAWIGAQHILLVLQIGVALLGEEGEWFCARKGFFLVADTAVSAEDFQPNLVLLPQRVLSFLLRPLQVLARAALHLLQQKPPQSSHSQHLPMHVHQQILTIAFMDDASGKALILSLTTANSNILSSTFTIAIEDSTRNAAES